MYDYEYYDSTITDAIDLYVIGVREYQQEFYLCKHILLKQL